MAITRADQNRKIRQEALREQLASQGHVQHVIELLGEISNPAKDIDKGMVDRYKIVIDTKMKLIGKYLPDLKAVEATISGDADQPIKHTIEFINGTPSSPDSV